MTLRFRHCSFYVWAPVITFIANLSLMWMLPRQFRSCHRLSSYYKRSLSWWSINLMPIPILDFIFKILEQVVAYYFLSRHLSSHNKSFPNRLPQILLKRHCLPLTIIDSARWKMESNWSHSPGFTLYAFDTVDGNVFLHRLRSLVWSKFWLGTHYSVC